MSQNSMLTFLQGEVKAEEYTISLKSCVPVFMVLPQLIHPFGGSISKIQKYYDESIDYNAPGNIYTKNDTSNKELMYLTSKVLENVITGAIKGSSYLEHLPKLYLKVDIAPRDIGFMTIGPDIDTVNDYDSRINSAFSMRTFFSALVVEEGNINHKHNILLVDELNRITNDSGLGGTSWR